MPLAFPLAEDSLRLAAGPRTDWFVDPGSGAATLNAPSLLGPVRGDFMLGARVEVPFAATFDAGVLVLRHEDRTWAKLCFEYSPDGEPMVVSVVTHDVSDDCNSVVVDGNVVFLRVARIGPACAFHWSDDGRRWRLVRHFRLVEDDVLEAGFLAQSPIGDGCSVTFSEVRFSATTLPALRTGV
jgi:hypothetical protein